MKIHPPEPDKWRSEMIEESASDLSLAYAKLSCERIPDGLINNPIVGEDAKNLFRELIDLINFKIAENMGLSQDEKRYLELDSVGSLTLLQSRPSLDKELKSTEPHKYISHNSEGVMGDENEEVIALRTDKDNFLTLMESVTGSVRRVSVELRHGKTNLIRMRYIVNDHLGIMLYAHGINTQSNTVENMDTEELYDQIKDWVNRYEVPHLTSSDDIVREVIVSNNGKIPLELARNIIDQNI